MKKFFYITCFVIMTALLSLSGLVGCSGDDEDSYFGTYYAGYPSDTSAAKLTITEDYVSTGYSQYEYTYSDGTITLSTNEKIKIAENNQVAYYPKTLMLFRTPTAASARLTVRDGCFSGSLVEYLIDNTVKCTYAFTVDGTFSITNPQTFHVIEGTYSLKNGVLAMLNKSMPDIIGTSASSRLHFWYIDENFNIYSAALVKDYTSYIGSMPTDPEIPNDPTDPDPLPDEQTYTVTWYNYDGTVLEEDRNVKYGTMPSYDGETPAKEPSEYCEFVFSGWSPKVSIVTGNAYYMAEYALRDLYTVTWENFDYTVLEVDKSVKYGTTPTYDGETPERASDGIYEYTFSGWSPSIAPVTQNVTYRAQFDENPIEVERSYTVTWKNYDGTVLEEDKNVKYGTMPSYDGETPVRATDEIYEYTFSGWSPSISNVYRNITYTAQYEENYFIPNLPQNTTPKLETPAYSFEGEGSESSPYLIKTSAQLLGIEAFPDKCFALADNIVLPSYDGNRPNFKPLFSDEKPFNGTLDGKGFSIENLVLYNTETYYTGLFACVGESGKVKNLNLVNVNVFGANYIGGIAGLSYGAITDCSASGKITHISANSYKVFIGGIAGRLENIFDNCNTDVDITVYDLNTDGNVGGIIGKCGYDGGKNDPATDCSSAGAILINLQYGSLDAGGIVGSGGGNMVLSNCCNSGEITITGYGYNEQRIGGLVGYGNSNMLLSNCCNSGEITVTIDNNSSHHIGGLVGRYVDTIENSYNTGNITAIGGYVYVGGLVGDSAYNIINSYNTGNISAAGGNVGGLVGNNAYKITNSYNVGKITVDSGSANVGGLIGRGSATITNSHWLYDENCSPVNAVGYHESMGVPTNIGATKHTDITDFYTLAATLNGASETPVWENKTGTSLPTLITIESAE